MCGLSAWRCELATCAAIVMKTALSSLPLTLSLLLLTVATASVDAADCSSFNDGIDGPYWYVRYCSATDVRTTVHTCACFSRAGRPFIAMFDCSLLAAFFVLPRSVSVRSEVAVCPACALEDDCVYCLSTLQCQAKDSAMPCPQPVEDMASCPVKPDCGLLTNCSACAAADDCAYVDMMTVFRSEYLGWMVAWFGD